MFVIIGLGNPEEKYAGTRHNAGFDVINKLADKYRIDVTTRKSRAYVGSGVIAGRKVLLVKPQTFMNLSGESVRSVMDFYKLDPETEMLVIYDDINLEPGSIRVRKKGSAGGHNGMKNIILHLGTSTFPRLRVGVGEKPKEFDLADFVLSHFSKSEKEAMQDGYEKAVSAVEMILMDDIDGAMNLFNKKAKPKEN